MQDIPIKVTWIKSFNLFYSFNQNILKDWLFSMIIGIIVLRSGGTVDWLFMLCTYPLVM